MARKSKRQYLAEAQEQDMKLFLAEFQNYALREANALAAMVRGQNFVRGDDGKPLAYSVSTADGIVMKAIHPKALKEQMFFSLKSLLRWARIKAEQDPRWNTLRESLMASHKNLLKEVQRTPNRTIRFPEIQIPAQE